MRRQFSTLQFTGEATVRKVWEGGNKDEPQARRPALHYLCLMDEGVLSSII